MKFNKLILIILIVFLKTGNVLSNSNIFNVNNIEIEKKGKVSNEVLASQAIKKGFNALLNKILLVEDKKKLKDLKLSEIEKLVNYYQVSNKTENSKSFQKINFNISFDKDKIHDLFYKRNISYSDIINKELFILPVLKKNNQIFIYNNNYFYDEWNNILNTDLIEFILPLENIEIIQNINFNKNNLINLDLGSLLEEYSGKNIAFVLIESTDQKEKKIYLKAEISGKTIIKKIKIKKINLTEEEYDQKIINDTKVEITNLIKSQNLIDIRTPSFLNAQLKLKKKNSFVDLKSRIQKIDAIQNIFIQEFNNENVILKMKYLGKLDMIIKQLENEKIILKFSGDQWSIKII